MLKWIIKYTCKDLIIKLKNFGNYKLCLNIKNRAYDLVRNLSLEL